MDEEKVDELTEEEVKDLLESVNEDTSKLESEILNGYKVVDFSDKKYRIYYPKIKEEQIISDFRTKISLELLNSKDSLLREQIVQNLISRGLWNDDKEKQEKTLRERLGKCLADIYTQKSRKKPDENLLKELVKEKILLEARIDELTSVKLYWTQNSAESKIEENVMKCKLVLCVKDENDVNVWNSIDELHLADKGLVIYLMNQAMYFWMGLDPSRFELAPSV